LSITKPRDFGLVGLYRYKYRYGELGHHWITAQLLALPSELDEFQGAWRALETIALGSLSALKRIAIIESNSSSTRIEGSKLTDREVEPVNKLGATSEAGSGRYHRTTEARGPLALDAKTTIC
jgi:hypothetical protein